MTTSTLEEQRIRNNLLQSCKSCGHLKVCAVYRAIAPLLSQSWTDENRPFEPENLAVICREYVPLSALKVLREGA